MGDWKEEEEEEEEDTLIHTTVVAETEAKVSKLWVGPAGTETQGTRAKLCVFAVAAAILKKSPLAYYCYYKCKEVGGGGADDSGGTTNTHTSCWTVPWLPAHMLITLLVNVNLNLLLCCETRCDSPWRC